MLPEPNTKHVEDARKLLISQYQKKPVIQGFLDSYIRRLQDAEDVLWDIVDAFILDNATGAQLNVLGNLVLEPRRGRTDPEYRVSIRIKILVNRSRGRIEDIVAVAGLSNSPNTPVVEDHRYLNFHVEAYGQVGERFLAEHLTKARAAASYGCLVTSDYPLEYLAQFDDATDPDPSIETFSDIVSGEGKLACACYGLPSDLTGAVLTGTWVDVFEELLGEDGEAMLTEGGESITAES